MPLLRRRASLSTIRQQIIGINQKVPIHDGRYVRYINLDNAATTPTLRPVLDKVLEFLPWYSGVHRGSGYKSLVSTAMYDDARMRIARFFNGPDIVAIFARIPKPSTWWQPACSSGRKICLNHPDGASPTTCPAGSQGHRADVLADGSLDEERFEKSPSIWD